MRRPAAAAGVSCRRAEVVSRIVFWLVDSGVCFLMFGVSQMAETKDGEKTYDPFEPFREMRDAYLEGLSKTMIDVVNTDSYAQATGAMLDYYLTASSSFREALEKTMLRALQQLSLPSRQEVANLAERFTNVEMRLDDMDAKLDVLVKEIGLRREPESTASQSKPGPERSPRQSPPESAGPAK
jgi:hypothetical protein